MRHRVYGKHLSRDKDKKEALFKSLVSSLIMSEKIKTTQAKAKAIKGLIDKIINQAKTPNTRRLVSQFLVKKEIQEKLIKDLVPRLKERTSGYTSIVRLGRRLGDGAMMVQIRLITDVAKSKQTSKRSSNATKSTPSRKTGSSK